MSWLWNGMECKREYVDIQYPSEEEIYTSKDREQCKMSVRAETTVIQWSKDSFGQQVVVKREES